MAYNPRVLRLGSGPTLLLGLALAVPAAAQSAGSPGLDELPRDAPATAPRVPPPRLSLRVVAELPVPGPLVGPGPRTDGSRLAVDVAGGVALVDPEGDHAVSLGPQAPAVDSPEPLSPDGRFRTRFGPSGELLLERRSRRRDDRWRRCWKLRVPGRELPRPVVAERRVFYGAADNVIYCVKRKNGHRVWEHDAGGRIVHGLSLWPDPASPSGVPPVRLVLAVTDSPARLLALDSRTGETVTSFELDEHQSVVGSALVLPEGRIVIGRQDFDPGAARLVVLEVVPDLPESAAATPAEERVERGR